MVVNVEVVGVMVVVPAPITQPVNEMLCVKSVSVPPPVPACGSVTAQADASFQYTTLKRSVGRIVSRFDGQTVVRGTTPPSE